MTSSGIRGSIQALRDLPDNPVAVLLERLHRQSRDYHLGWFARPMFIALASLMFAVTVLIISRQHWALSLHDPQASNPLYIQSSQIVSVMACLWFFYNLAMLMAFSRMLSAAQQAMLLLGGGRSNVSAVRIDDLLQGNPLDAETILEGLSAFHRRRVAPLLWYPCLYVVLSAILKFPVPLYDNGTAHWHWEFLLIPLCGPVFYFIAMAVFRLLLHCGVLIGHRFAHPLAQQLALWLLISAPVLATLAVAFILRAQNLPDDVNESLSVLSVAVMLAVPLLLSRLLRKRALATIDATVKGLHDRQTAESLATHRSIQDAAQHRLLRPVYALVLGLPILLAISVFIHTTRLSPLKFDTGDPFINWYFGYAQQTVERQWMQHLDPKPVRLERPGSSLANGHYYIHALMQEAEPQFGADPRWQLLRYEMLNNMQEQTLAFEYGEAADNQELARLLLQQSIDNGVENPAGDLWLLQEHWITYRDAADKLSDPQSSTELEKLRLEIAAQARELAAKHNEAAPLYWLALADHTLDDEQVMELISQGNSRLCRFHTGSFRNILAAAIPPGSAVLHDRVLCGMQPMEYWTTQDYAVINAITLKNLIRRLAAQRDLAALEQIHVMLVRQLETSDLNEISSLIAFVCLSVSASEVNSQCQPDAEQQQALTEFDKLATDLRADMRQMFRNWPWDLSATLDRQAQEYLPFELHAVLADPLSGIESRLSLGRQYAIYYYYELNTNTGQEMDVIDWYRSNADRIERLGDFSFETLSWEENQISN